MNAAGMQQIENGLRTHGFAVIPSQANFVYFDVKRDGRRVFDALLRLGIIVRHIEGTMLRVTIGQPDENQAFLDALKQALESE